MLRFFFSHEGRFSRRELRLGFLLMAVALLPGAIVLLFAPYRPWWFMLAIMAGSFAVASVGAAAMGKKRAHDLGASSIGALRPLAPWTLWFREGEPQANRYGPASGGREPSLRIGRWAAVMAALSIIAFAIFAY